MTLCDVAGIVLAAYGAEMVDAKGNITVKSDAIKQVLDRVVYPETWRKLDGAIFVCLR